jgi:hypothetical protein
MAEMGELIRGISRAALLAFAAAVLATSLANHIWGLTWPIFGHFLGVALLLAAITVLVLLLSAVMLQKADARGTFTGDAETDPTISSDRPAKPSRDHS